MNISRKFVVQIEHGAGIDRKYQFESDAVAIKFMTEVMNIYRSANVDLNKVKMKFYHVDLAHSNQDVFAQPDQLIEVVYSRLRAQEDS